MKLECPPGLPYSGQNIHRNFLVFSTYSQKITVKSIFPRLLVIDVLSKSGRMMSCREIDVFLSSSHIVGNVTIG